MKRTATKSAGDASPAGTHDFYRNVLEVLNDASVPYVVGGGYALKHYTGVNRLTKDIDIFIHRHDFDRVCEILTGAGYETELTYPHWLAKTCSHGEVIDLVFSSGNGVSDVDNAWFEHAASAEVLGVPTKLSPIEEMLWSKAYIMERERYDGADIAHLILACSEQIDWERLLERFGSHWRLLLSHLVLFGFIYPGQRDLVPAWVMERLIKRLGEELHSPGDEDALCAGTLLSREQYLTDIQRWGYDDARVTPRGNMSRQDTVAWTNAIEKKSH